MLKELLEKGHFPAELPPPYSSTSAGALATHSDINFWTGKALHGKSVSYNLARTGGVRRRLSIPNAIHHARLSKLISDNWTGVFEPVYAKSTISMSKPRTGGYRALVPQKTFQDLYLVRADVRAGGRFLLKADISRCYFSIYTHSVEWAASSKAAAKARVAIRGAATPGSMLDDFIRAGQSNQTMGIPVGPDTSLAIAELVLCAADSLLQDRYRDRSLVGKYYRYIDDYEMAFSSFDAAQEALSILQSVLSDFELDLNPRKTWITPLPDVFDEPWATELKGTLFRPSSRGQRRDIIRFFDRSVALARAHTDEHVLKYSIGILRNIELSEDDWILAQYWLLQCVITEPGTLPSILSEFIYYKNLGYRVDNDRFAAQMQSLIVEHAPMGHSSEVVWAIWSMISMGQVISDDVADIISAMDDSVVALMALYARDQKIIKKLSTTVWQQYINGDELWGANWLLSYEASERGWLTSSSSPTFVQKDPFFNVLHKQGVRFFDETRKTTPGSKPNETLALDSPAIAKYP